MKVLRLFRSPLEANAKFKADAERLKEYARVDHSNKRIGVANIEYVYYGGASVHKVKSMRIDKLIVENASGIPSEVLFKATEKAKEVRYE